MESTGTIVFEQIFGKQINDYVKTNYENGYLVPGNDTQLNINQ